ncbi:MAG TPA: ion channel [Microbacteriaceae bacterium]|nr:ion channel [Microbacteriaceae bacterium]
MEASAARLAEWERLVRIPLLVLGILFIVAASVFALMPDLHPLPLLAAVVAMLVAWLAFGADYIVRVALTPRGKRMSWVLHHPLLLAAVVLPVFRAVRVVDLLREIPAFRSDSRSVLRAQIVISALAYSLVFVYFVALSTLVAERDAPGATITNFPDALWWAAVTLTTVGYGDVVPITVLGRLYAVLLMLGGIVIIGVASGTAVSYISERVRGHDRDVERHQGSDGQAGVLRGTADTAGASATDPRTPPNSPQNPPPSDSPADAH